MYIWHFLRNKNCTCSFAYCVNTLYTGLSRCNWHWLVCLVHFFSKNRKWIRAEEICGVGYFDKFLSTWIIVKICCIHGHMYPIFFVQTYSIRSVFSEVSYVWGTALFMKKGVTTWWLFWGVFTPPWNTVLLRNNTTKFPHTLSQEYSLLWM